MSDEVVVVATVSVKPGEMDALMDAVSKVIGGVHAENGCLLYAVHRGEDQLVFVERWTSVAALDAHSSGPAVAEIGKAMGGHVAGGGQVLRLTAVPAGDPVKGAIS